MGYRKLFVYQTEVEENEKWDKEERKVLIQESILF